MCESWCQELSSVLPKGLLTLILQQTTSGDLEEIRLRAQRPVQLKTADRDVLLDRVSTKEELEALLERMCDHSIYACDQELTQGYITLRGGHRAGLCGKTTRQGDAARITEIGGINIRIAKAHPGCSTPLLQNLIDGYGRPVSTLIISAPGVGKTTMLRDIARSFSYGINGTAACDVCIADERSEIAACVNGVPMLDVGPRTDVMDRCAKDVSMGTMIRSMSPRVIITDELGSMRDANAVRDAAACGVAVIASAHADTLESALKRDSLAALLRGPIKKLIVLERTGRKMRFEAHAAGA